MISSGKDTNASHHGSEGKSSLSVQGKTQVPMKMLTTDDAQTIKHREIKPISNSR